MKVNVHIFNVKHGDSILVEYIYENSSYWLLIDCNVIRKGDELFNPALEFLRKKNIKRIEAIVVTHLHGDHYTGMDDIINEFEIGKIIIPPFLSLKSSIFEKQIQHIKTKVSDLMEISSDEEIGKQANSLVKILWFMQKNKDKVMEATGKESNFRLSFYPEPLGVIYLPLAKIKNRLHQILEKGDYELDTFANMNEASIALSLKIHNNKILFGADSTASQWQEHSRQLSVDKVTCLDANFLKAPHHGSRHDNTLKIYNYLLRPNSNNFLFISANGKSHPHDEIFKLINELNISPYCTNIARQCLGANVISISGLAKIPSDFRSFIASYEIDDLPTPCQGDITIEFTETSTNIYSSTGNTCVYRPLHTVKIKELI